MATTPIILRSQPGIKRDGTRFEGDFYVDGQWVRFQRGLPRKIGGYTAINKYITEISRGLKTYTSNGFTYFHTGSANLLERLTIASNGATSIITDRTPTTLDANDQNAWQFDVVYDAQSVPPKNLLVAQVAPNLEWIANTEGGQIFTGEITDTGVLTEITSFPTGASATGGVCVLHPYLTYFGNDGVIGWSVASDPTDLTSTGSGSARVAANKIVRGLPLRGGAGNAPAGLYWSIDSVIRASFVGGDSVFQFDTITCQSSILSPNSVIEYDGQYFWCGTDRFLVFNGVVREVPNQLSLNYFFDGLNRNATQKVFAFKVPRFGEIWWCYPRGDATECTHAVIYNVRENTWYDTELPNGGRSAGEFVPAIAAPLLCGIELSDVVENFRITQIEDQRITEDGRLRILEDDAGYKLWQHERGVNEIDGQFITAVPSFFETADFSLLVSGQNKYVRVDFIEPDFVQSENMTVQMTGRSNAKAAEVDGPIRTIFATPSTPDQQVVNFKESRRELRFKFTSNTINGDYQMGQIIAHIEPADGTHLGAVE